MLRSGNPTLRADTFSDYMPPAARAAGGTMTIQGTVNKTGILLAILLVPAFWTWSLYFSGQVATAQILLIGGLIGSLIFAIATVIKKTWAPVTAPLYAACEGLLLGALSATFEQRFPGIVIQAVGLTFGVMGALLLAYTSRLIKATENFKLGLAAATGGIMLFYLVQLGLALFGIRIPMIHESGIVGIGFSLVVVTIAALNLVMDFDFIEHGAERGAPKHMEWYGAFGLVVTLAWLYLELLRLLSKLNSRN